MVVELREQKFKDSEISEEDERLEKLIEKTIAKTQARAKKDIWDKIAALAPIVSGVLIFVMGGLFTFTFNQQQLKLQEIQTIEKFIPHLMGNEQTKKAAILAISQLTNPEMASRFASIFASPGTVSALQSMSETGSAREKNIASKAMADALESLANRESKLSSLEQNYQQSLQAKASNVNDPDYVYNLSKLGEAYKIRGNTSLAEPLLAKALTVKEKVYGAESAEVADALRSMAELSLMNGNKSQAEAYLKRAKTIDAKFASAVPGENAGIENSASATESTEKTKAESTNSESKSTVDEKEKENQSSM